MKRAIRKIFHAKGRQREKNASKPVAEKLRMLDRLKERDEQIKKARPVGTGGDGVRPDRESSA